MPELKVVSSESTNKHFCEWLTRATNNTFVLDPAHTRTIAHVETHDGTSFSDEDILAVCAYHNWTPHSAEVTIASNGVKRAKATRTYIWHCFNYIFNVAGKSRINGFIAVENDKSQAVADMLRLTKLCTVEDHYGPGKNAYFYGLTKTDWLNGPWSVLEQTTPINKNNKDGEQ